VGIAHIKAQKHFSPSSLSLLKLKPQTALRFRRYLPKHRWLRRFLHWAIIFSQSYSVFLVLFASDCVL